MRSRVGKGVGDDDNLVLSQHRGAHVHLFVVVETVEVPLAVTPVPFQNSRLTGSYYEEIEIVDQCLSSGTRCVGGVIPRDRDFQRGVGAGDVSMIHQFRVGIDAYQIQHEQIECEGVVQRKDLGEGDAAIALCEIWWVVQGDRRGAASTGLAVEQLHRGTRVQQDGLDEHTRRGEALAERVGFVAHLFPENPRGVCEVLAHKQRRPGR